jgi:hypothetical protein
LALKTGGWRHGQAESAARKRLVEAESETRTI